MKKAPVKFNRKSVSELADYAIDCINTCELPDGITVEKKGGTFDARTFTMKIEFTLTECKEKSIDELKYESDQSFTYMSISKLPAWGFKFRTSQGDEYQMTGYSRRAKKFPIIAKKLADGREYKFPINTILNSCTIL